MYILVDLENAYPEDNWGNVSSDVTLLEIPEITSGASPLAVTIASIIWKLRGELVSWASNVKVSSSSKKHNFFNSNCN